MKKTFILLAGCLLAISLAGCGDSAKKVAQQFYTALKEGDMKTFKATSTKSTQKELGSLLSWECGFGGDEMREAECFENIYGKRFNKIEFVSEEETDYGSLVKLNLISTSNSVIREEVSLAKVDGAWKVAFNKKKQ